MPNLMAAPVGLGDGIALYEICKKLAIVIQDFKNAPAEYEASTQSLCSLQGAFTCMTEALGEYASAVSPASNIRDANSLACSLRELKLAETSLREARDILKKRYDKPTSSGYSLRWMSRLRWTSTKSRVETSIRYAHQHLQVVHSLTAINNLYESAPRSDGKLLTHKLTIYRMVPEKIRVCMAAIQLEMNDRPLPIGLPGSGGVPKDHIHFKFGLGADTYLLMHLGSSLQVCELLCLEDSVLTVMLGVPKLFGIHVQTLSRPAPCRKGVVPLIL